jgi:hypothetical protein
MDTKEIYTLTGFGILAITTVISILKHSIVVREVGRLAKDLEDLKLVNKQVLLKTNYDLENRRKAEMVAELFSLWIQGGTGSGPGHMSTRKFSPDDFKRLNELSFMCSFWLPQRILDDLNNTLGNVKGAKNIKEIVVDVRKFLNENAGVVDPMSIIHF